jgi:hypothetical protein
MASEQMTSLDDLISKQLSKKGAGHILNLRRSRRRRRILAAPRDAAAIVARESVAVYRAELAKVR